MAVITAVAGTMAVAVITAATGTMAVAVTMVAVAIDNVATEAAVGIPALARAVITIFFGLRRQ